MADVFEHATWLYGPEDPDGRLFQAGEAVPASGWTDAPGGPEKAPSDAKDRDALMAALDDRKIPYDRRWGVARLSAELEAAKAS